MSRESIKTSLEKMGYNLKDCGNHWRTNALYRGGTNPTSLLIYKNTGVWNDFVKNSPPLPFKELVFATLKTNDEEQLHDFLNGTNDITEGKPKHSQISSEKIYPIDMLSRLLPHYIFYEQKGIQKDCLSNLRSGLATEGSMYQRFVFPIFNQHGQIHGFSGRDMLNKKDRPKWKLVGKKNTWIYPMHVNVDGEKVYLNSVIESRSIVLVESIGDMLALHSCGIFNCAVLFGTAISSSLLCFLVSLDLDSIYISLNNDANKERNSGRIGSIKTFIKLSDYFSCSKLHICPPTQNDFGDMSCTEINSWYQKLGSLKTDTSDLLIECESLLKNGEISKSCHTNLKKNI